MTDSLRDAPSKREAAGALPGKRPLLSLRELQVQFATKRGLIHAVDGVSFDIGEGETLGLVGETGSGKSVTARSLVRLVQQPPGRYAGGKALFRPQVGCPSCHGIGCNLCDNIGRINASCPACGGTGCQSCGMTGNETVDLLAIPERRIRRIRGNHIAMIFQDPGKALDPRLSVRSGLAEVFAEHRTNEILREAGIDPAEANFLVRRDAANRCRLPERLVLSAPPFRHNHRRLEAVIDERIARALADTHIPTPRKVMNRYPHELSGGMKQRVMIAQALAANPELLIADEPTTALDVTIQARILDLLTEIQERLNTAVLYISHDLSLVRRISDRVAVMYAGRIVETGQADEIFDEPLHPYTRGLLGAIPSPLDRRGELLAIEGTVPENLEVGRYCRFSSRCPHSAPTCAQTDPTLSAQGGGRTVACFLYERPDEVGASPADMPVWAQK